MKGDSGKLSARQRLALPIMAAEPTIEGAAERIGVSRKTLYEWLKQEPFRQALENARKEYVESGFRAIRLAAKRAADKIIQHLENADPKVSLRAAEDVIKFAEAIERDELENRLEDLEGKVRQFNRDFIFIEDKAGRAVNNNGHKSEIEINSNDFMPASEAKQ